MPKFRKGVTRARDHDFYVTYTTNSFSDYCFGGGSVVIQLDCSLTVAS